MKLLTAEKAPFFLVLLITAMAWQITQLVNETRSNPKAISYQILIRDGNEAWVSLRNESRTKSITKARFALSCVSTTKDPFGPGCFTMRGYRFDDEYYAATTLRPPVLVRPNITHDTSREILFEVSLPPLAVAEVGGRLDPAARVTDASVVQFFLVPDEGAPEDFYLYQRNTFIGFFTENLTTLLAASLATCVALTLVYLAVLGRARRKRTSHDAESPES